MRLTSILVLAFVLAAVLAPPAYAAGAIFDTDTTVLAQADPSLDGLSVRFTGEAVGEALRAGSDHRWLSVLADGTAIGAFVTTRQADLVDGFGDWSTTGSMIEVTGVYNVACDQHGGDLDVHAEDVRVIAPSVARSHPIDRTKAAVAAVATVIGLAFAYRLKASRARRG